MARDYNTIRMRVTTGQCAYAYNMRCMQAPLAAFVEHSFPVLSVDLCKLMLASTLCCTARSDSTLHVICDHTIKWALAAIYDLLLQMRQKLFHTDCHATLMPDSHCFCSDGERIICCDPSNHVEARCLCMRTILCKRCDCICM